MNEIVKDPVCHMEVPAASFAIEYAGVPYAFCSAQCQERFLANPHLYVGMPGQKAPKQKGLEVIKQRRIRLVQPLSADQTATLINILQAMMGIKAVTVEGENITIVYDLLQATAEQIETRLSEIGVQLGEGWTERLRRAFVHYEEECEVGSLEVQPPRHLHG